MIRWVISPVVEIVESWVDEDGQQQVGEPLRVPYVRTLVDPSTGRRYSHSSAIMDGEWALSFVRGDDFTPIDHDPLCVDVLEADYDDADGMLANTPRGLGWNAARLNRARGLLAEHGVDHDPLAEDTPLWEWLQTLGRKAMPTFTPRGTWVR